MFQDQIFKAFIPSRLDLLLNQFDKSTDISQLLAKYDLILQSYKSNLNLSGLELILKPIINDQGEFILDPITDTLKSLTQEAMSEYRTLYHFLGEREEYWIKEYQSRDNQEEEVKNDEQSAQ